MPGFNSEELVRPPSRAEQQAKIKAWKALELWAETGSESEVAKALRLTKESARVLINRGVALYDEQRADTIGRLRFKQQRDLDGILDGWRGTSGTDRTSAEMVVKAWERSSKLHGLDAQKEGDGGPQIFLVETRKPWERGEPDVIVELEALEGGSPSTDPPEETP